MRKSFHFTFFSCLLLVGCENNLTEPLQSASHVYIEGSPEIKSFSKELWSVTVDTTIQDLSLLTYKKDRPIEFNPLQTFAHTYTNIEGVLTFRGNHTRTAPSYGTISSPPKSLEKAWEFQTSYSPDWGGGAGWTGQPALIKWEDDVKQIMNLKEEFKAKEDFVEVIYASLDGHIYFFDLETGVQSRSPLTINNPIKGSVSIDPRGYPLLYVGQGIPQTGHHEIGYRIFSLIDGSLLHFIKGSDGFAYRSWGAFDGAPLINKDTDSMFIGGENGIFYSTLLNTRFDQEAATISVQPETIKYRYKINGNPSQGIENSVAAYKNLLYFADNGGSIQALDLRSMEPIWALPATDDTDASIVVEETNNVPFLYTGTEVDKQGTRGNSMLRKINGLTGEVVWHKDIPALSQLGARPVNGGLLATPIIGSNSISNIVIFTICRYQSMERGIMLALDKETGEEVWSFDMPHYAWSSPVPIYTDQGEAFIVQSDSVGNIYIINGSNGEVMDTTNFNSNIEASPAIYNNMMVVANRGGQIGAFYIR
ncbi:PQQ-binding-like beta-propeller repeat protein [Bacillus pinisoli]|uniref:outer membrane protein assembly factor BamB family protein n=1 Tax=Bacillus pinisoli TaxID=2901866 RepID=UPI001FF33366|nr:PQQ-binding-like beta-propeller repeat protein [Bacillus pinisoli]